MTNEMTTPQAVVRILKLLNILAAPGAKQDVATLANHFETSEKTIRRDIAQLRESGIEVCEEAERNNHKRYWIDKQSIPPVKLTFDEALAVWLGYSNASTFRDYGLEPIFQSALEKVRLAFGKAEADYVRKLTDRVHFVRNHPAEAPDILNEMLIAIEDRRAIFIEYHSASSTEPLTYDIHPYGIAEHRGSLYVVGYSCHHGEIRTWKMDRMLSVDLTLMPFQEPVGFSVAKYLDGAFAIITGEFEYEVVIRFSGSAVRYVTERKYHPSQTIEQNRDGSVTVKMKLRSLIEVRSWVLSFGSNATVLSPDSFRESVQQELLSTLRLYSDRQASAVRTDIHVDSPPNSH